jgi:hypothetical protein
MNIFRSALLFALASAGTNAFACYTVFDAKGRMAYQGQQPPVDMSVSLGDALAKRFSKGATIVFDQDVPCRPLGLAEVDRLGRVNARGASPLLTDRATAQGAKLAHKELAQSIVVVPAHAAARAKISTFNVVPSGQ